MHTADKGGDHLIRHDLNFQKPKYEMIHTVVRQPFSSLFSKLINPLLQTFTNPRANLAKLLAQSGPVPGYDGTPADENGVGKRDKRKHDGDDRVKKKGKSEKQVWQFYALSLSITVYSNNGNSLIWRNWLKGCKSWMRIVYYWLCK